MTRDLLCFLVGTVVALSGSGAAAAASPEDEATPVMTLEAKDAAGNDLRDVRVTVDGKPLVDRLEGRAFAIDPGEHRLVFSADGFATLETTVVVHVGDRRRRVLVFLNSKGTPGVETASVPLPATPLPAKPTLATPAPAASAPGLSVTRPATTDVPARWPRRKTASVALAAAAAGSLAVGAIWGLMARSTYNNAIDAECGGDPNGCTSRGIADGRTAHQQAAVATAGFVGAVALFAAAATLHFTTPKEGPITVAPSVASSGAGMTIAGSW